VGPWRVDITRRPGVARLVPAAHLARLVATALEAAGAPRPAALSLILADDRELTRLNRQAMGHRGATDVLSFPLLPAEAYPAHAGQTATDGEAGSAASGAQMAAGSATASGAGAGSAPRPPDFVLPPGRRPLLGEVVVSVERAVAQAEAGLGGQTGNVRWTAADELRLLVAHGVLHVCGWDHALPAEREPMRALERELLAR
jgi:ssRNA-specific RNase YbeY (16S rRNA maturation enzyme)